MSRIFNPTESTGPIPRPPSMSESQRWACSTVDRETSLLGNLVGHAEPPNAGLRNSASFDFLDITSAGTAVLFLSKMSVPCERSAQLL